MTIGSRRRTSPYYQATLAAGVASFTIYNGMYMPTGYGDPDAEYRRLTQGVAMWDVAAERQVEIAGPDAEALANYVTARDLRGMKVGRARYSPMCDFEGRLINDPVVLKVGEDRYWLSIADSQILLWVKAIAGSRGDQVEVAEPDVSPLAIQGPNAAIVAGRLFGDDLVNSLGFFHHTETAVDGIPLVLCRSGWSKQGGFELFLTDGSRGNDLWNAVLDAGRDLAIGPGSPNQQERIESGLLSFGSDHDTDIDPIEAGLAQYTSLDDGHEFIGRTALEARAARPVQRPIVNVRLDGNPIPCQSPWPAHVDGEPVGELRNAVWSTVLDEWIGLAQLSTPHATPGVVVEVLTPDGIVNATVHDTPFGTIQTAG